jgi:hypothetical protein
MIIKRNIGFIDAGALKPWIFYPKYRLVFGGTGQHRAQSLQGSYSSNNLIVFMIPISE